MANDPWKKIQEADKRRARSVRRVQTLVGQGVPFNPAGASGEARTAAADNVNGRSKAGARIFAGEFGTARAPKGGPVTFR
jgi:hypothetical protein